MTEQLSPIGRFERILLATDGSASCADAERLAFTMAEEWKVALKLLTVIISNTAAMEAAPDLSQAADERARALLERLYGDAVQRAVAAEKIVRRGTEPYVEILAAAEEQQADVIVMGRSGEPGLVKRVLGDITSHIVGRARCSVLVVPIDAGMWRRRILLATDGSRFSDAASVAAARLAERCALPVTVISVVRESFSEERAAAAEQAAVRVHDHLANRGIDSEWLVLRGDSAQVIAETAASREADLIVLGTHGRTGWERVRVGSVTESVIRLSTCPVLAVKG